MGEMDEVVQEFLTESAENLDRLDREFVELEQDPSRLDLLTSIFRTIHTIKGTCGFLGYSHLEHVAHAGETLLSKLRDGVFAYDRDAADVLLALVDAVRTMLAQVATTGADGDDAYEGLVARLLEQSERQPPETAEEGSAEVGATAADTDNRATSPDPTEARPAAAPAANRPDPAPVEVDHEPEPEATRVEPAPTVRAPAKAGSANPTLVPQPGGNTPQIVDQSIRVDVALLEKLMNLVGEQVLARNQLQRYSNASDDPALHALYQQLDIITSKLQEGMMRTRMQPVGSAWAKLPRLVRDVSAVCGKQVRLVRQGEDTEVDRTLIDAIRDPLTHIVRNSVDHGIEKPEVRVAAGKSPEGTVTLRAWHEGGQVHIEVADDGGGLRTDKILKKAIERGLVSPEQAETLTQREITDLLFQPGFSTADQVTSVSGRGVGMDVVRTDIAAVNGAVDISSKPGEGTSLRIRIPLTLAIIPALLVESNGETFAVPQVSVIQLLRFDEGRAEQSELVHETRLFRFHGELLPLLLLDEELQLRPVGRHIDVGVLILQAGDRKFGLAVDRIGDYAEIVVKPLSRTLKQIGTFAGATIAGDGRVALILDVAGLARRAQIDVERRAAAEAAAKQGEEWANASNSFLIVRTPDDGRAAIPLESVNRLEEVPASEVQSVGAREVIVCRGQILPLIRLSDALRERRSHPRSAPTPPPSAADPLQVVVHESAEGAVGIVPDQILEIVDSAIVTRFPAVRPGVHYSATIGERVTEILDLSWFASQALAPVGAAHE